MTYLKGTKKLKIPYSKGFKPTEKTKKGFKSYSLKLKGAKKL